MEFSIGNSNTYGIFENSNAIHASGWYTPHITHLNTYIENFRRPYVCRCYPTCFHEPPLHPDVMSSAEYTKNHKVNPRSSPLSHEKSTPSLILSHTKNPPRHAAASSSTDTHIAARTRAASSDTALATFILENAYTGSPGHLTNYIPKTSVA